MIWVLTVGAISVFGAAAQWLRERWRAEVPSEMAWDEARQRLKKILWIDAIHDQPGEQVFKILNFGGEAAGINQGSSTAQFWASSWGGSRYELL